MEPAGDGVGALFELTPGMKSCENSGKRRPLGLSVSVDGDTTTVINNLNTSVGPKRDRDLP